MQRKLEVPPRRPERGLRLNGGGRSSTDKPLVSIITATFNASAHLSLTIKSIREQSYDNIEWIVVDGASKDATVELIRQNEDVIDCWVSEPDGGIYDAWNKGVLLANGDWIAFLGAGDSYMPSAIDTYMNAIIKSAAIPELASSQVRLVNGNGLALRVWGSPFKWDEFKKYMTIAHLGALHHRSLFEKHGLFDISYTSAADYEFLMRCGTSLKSIYLSDITANMLVGGISNGYKGMFETYLIQKRYGAGISANFRFLFACLKRSIRPLLRRY